MTTASLTRVDVALKARSGAIEVQGKILQNARGHCIYGREACLKVQAVGLVARGSQPIPVSVGGEGFLRSFLDGDRKRQGWSTC
jgi:hypothetical protein